MSTPVVWQPGMDITALRLEAMNQRQQFMVTNYGADSSGGTNAAPGIQAALDAARDLGGAQVLVPPGVYLIGQTLRIYNNTRLTLMQGCEFRRAVAGTMIINGDGGQSLGGYTGHSRIIIEGGLWNMRGTTGGFTASAMCISIGHATDIVIRDLEIRDVPGYHGIELNSTSHGLIENCKFRGYVDPGGRDFSEAIQIDLAKSVGVFGGFGPYDHTPCEDVLVTGCHFGASGTAGTTAWPRGVGSHSATIGRWHRRIRISNNSFEGVLQYGVSAYNYEDLTVTGNTFVSCGSGVRIRAVIKTDPEDTKDVNGNPTGGSQQMRNQTVTGNTFRDMGTYAHVIECIGETSGTIFNLAITGNVLDNSGTTANGIRLSYVERSTVVGNAIANMGNTGVSAANSNRVVVSDNQITWGHGYGMTIDTCSAVTLSGNQVSFAGKGGIWVSDSTDVQHRGNFVKGAGRDANATYYAYRVEGTASSSISFSGNKARPYGSGNECIHALSCTSSVSLVQRYGNDWRGAQWTAGAATPINDSSTSQNTSSADVLT